jgi:CheY-like chemotaxis protein
MADSGLKLYLVDDERLVLNAMRRDLSRFKLPTQVFVSPREALEAARAAPPDLLVTDLVMEEMDGLELVRALRRIYPRLRAVVVSTGSDSLLWDQAELSEVVQAVLPKPWPGDALRHAVADLFEN